MQYPIIEPFNYFALFNPITGITINNGANLSKFLTFENGYIKSTGEIGNSSDDRYSNEYIYVNEDTNFVAKFNYSNPSYGFGVAIYDENKTFLSRTYYRINSPENECLINVTANHYVRFTYEVYSNDTYDVIIYKNNASQTNIELFDIFNRVKLPLPHYFPYPVIDALISASTGQQTAEDTEILRHYLTPLGIGGI